MMKIMKTRCGELMIKFIAPFLHGLMSPCRNGGLAFPRIIYHILLPDMKSIGAHIRCLKGMEFEIMQKQAKAGKSRQKQAKAGKCG